MQDVRPKWLGNELVLVCERCLKERIPEEDPDVAARIGSFHLRDWLKAKLKEDGRWGQIRVVNSSCLDVCARGRVTVAIDRNGQQRAYIVDPLDDKDELYAKIISLLDSNQ